MAHAQVWQANIDSVLIHRYSPNPLSPGQGRLIIPGSFSWADTFQTLSYVYDPVLNVLLFQNFEEWKLQHPSDTLILRFRALPQLFQKEYRQYALGKSADQPTIAVKTETNQTDFLTAWRSDRKLRKSGSFIRGVTLGSNRDLSVNSGFRLELEGQLTDDVEIAAVLTDENLPIQPEGNTQTLQELDQVYIRLKHPTYQMVLGDYQIFRKGSELASFTRKLQGLELSADWKTVNSSVAFANAKGSFTSYSFNGIDGNQGPYRLRGKNQEKFILVLAGTERVYVNGQEVKRGETNEYVIDYASGEITFTPKILVTSATRITVDFEYSERLYARDFLYYSTGVNLPQSSFSAGISYFREADNPKAPIDLILTDSDRQLIKEAGNNPVAAAKSGIDSVGFDTETGIGKGLYRQRDTTYQNQTVRVYVYSPGHPEALYIVRFTETQAGTGSYQRKAFGVYEWVATGGNYEPVIYLPLPSSYQMVSSRLHWKPIKGISWQQELAWSDRDLNQESDVGDGNNAGVGIMNRLTWVSDSIGSKSERGVITVSAMQKYLDRQFIAPDRTLDAEFYRNLGTDEIQNQLFRQIGADAGYNSRTLTFLNGWSYLSQGNFSETNQYNVQYRQVFAKMIETDYQLTLAKTVNGFRKETTDWNQQKAAVSADLGTWTPWLKGLYERRMQQPDSRDSALAGSFRAVEAENGITWDPELIRLSLSGKIRLDEEPDSGRIALASRAYTGSMDFSTKSFETFSSIATVTHYRKYYTETFRLKGNENTEATLLRMTNRWFPLNQALDFEWEYQVNTQQTSKLDQIYIRVRKGFGNYIWIDRNENGIQENNEFEPTRFDDGEYILRTFPGEELEPIIDLNTQLRIKWNPSRHDYFSFLPDFIKKRWTTETLLRLDEKSKTSRLTDVYFLNLSTFMDEVNTLAGTQQVIQDFYLDQTNRNLNWRFRFEERESMVQYSLDTENKHFSERSVRVNARFGRNWTTKTDVNQTVNSFSSQKELRPTFTITGYALTPDIGYRFNSAWDTGLRSSVDFRKSSKGISAEAFIISETIRVTWSLPGKGRLRTEGEWTQSKVKKDKDAIIPYELTNGNPEGRLIRLSSFFDYQISSLITSYISYEGRLINDEPAIHTLKAEIRAIF